MAQGGGRLPGDWMWQAAARLLDEVEQVQRRFFEPVVPPARPLARRAPVDVVEHDGEVTVVVALPGVPPERVSVAVTEAGVMVRGERAVPLGERAVLHRLEIPHGVFERRVALPSGRYELAGRDFRDGCLTLTFRRGAA